MIYDAGCKIYAFLTIIKEKFLDNEIIETNAADHAKD